MCLSRKVAGMERISEMLHIQHKIETVLPAA